MAEGVGEIDGDLAVVIQADAVVDELVVSSLIASDGALNEVAAEGLGLDGHFERPVGQREAVGDGELDVGVVGTRQADGLLGLVVGVAVGRVVAFLDFVGIAHSVVIGVGDGRVGAVEVLLAVEETVFIEVLLRIGDTVVVGVGDQRVGANLVFHQVGEAIARGEGGSTRHRAVRIVVDAVVRAVIDLVGVVVRVQASGGGRCATVPDGPRVELELVAACDDNLAINR